VQPVEFRFDQQSHGYAIKDESDDHPIDVGIHEKHTAHAGSDEVHVTEDRGGHVDAYELGTAKAIRCGVGGHRPIICRTGSMVATHDFVASHRPSALAAFTWARPAGRMRPSAMRRSARSLLRADHGDLGRLG
jgi:hypothetical protein